MDDSDPSITYGPSELNWGFPRGSKDHYMGTEQFTSNEGSFEMIPFSGTGITLTGSFLPGTLEQSSATYDLVSITNESILGQISFLPRPVGSPSLYNQTLPELSNLEYGSHALCIERPSGTISLEYLTIYGERECVSTPSLTQRPTATSSTFSFHPLPKLLRRNLVPKIVCLVVGVPILIFTLTMWYRYIHHQKQKRLKEASNERGASRTGSTGMSRRAL